MNELTKFMKENKHIINGMFIEALWTSEALCNYSLHQMLEDAEVDELLELNKTLSESHINDDKVINVFLETFDLPSFDIVETFGGEGKGDSVWVVVNIGEQFFKAYGYYTSYYGTSDWRGWYEVEPVQKVITVYKEK